MSAPLDGLKLLRKPFPDDVIGKLPKPTKAQTDEVRANYTAGNRCSLCGGWHHPSVVHLDYVGHAATTDRLLDADPLWTWEPMAYSEQVLPQFDDTGGLWIKLTVCGVTRIGYGNAVAKPGDPGNYEKEVIGDAIRNAAMRFGGALELWHKGELHKEDPEGGGGEGGNAKKRPALQDYPSDTFDKNFAAWSAAVKSGKLTAAEIIAMVSTKGVLSEDQTKRIKALEAPNANS